LPPHDAKPAQFQLQRRRLQPQQLLVQCLQPRFRLLIQKAQGDMQVLPGHLPPHRDFVLQSFQQIQNRIRQSQP
jgi:hypothetical protein